jgi:hypothetical protein
MCLVSKDIYRCCESKIALFRFHAANHSNEMEITGNIEFQLLFLAFLKGLSYNSYYQTNNIQIAHNNISLVLGGVAFEKVQLHSVQA